MNKAGFVQISNEIIRETAAEIGATAFMVFALLASMANKGGRCYPSMRYIAKTLAISKTTAVSAIKKLEKHKLIWTFQDEDEKSQVNRYQLIKRGNVVYKQTEAAADEDQPENDSEAYQNLNQGVPDFEPGCTKNWYGGVPEIGTKEYPINNTHEQNPMKKDIDFGSVDSSLDSFCLNYPTHIKHGDVRKELIKKTYEDALKRYSAADIARALEIYKKKDADKIERGYCYVAYTFLNEHLDEYQYFDKQPIDGGNTAWLDHEYICFRVTDSEGNEIEGDCIGQKIVEPIEIMK